MSHRRGKVFCWLCVILLPAFAVYPALLYPIEEHSYDAATFHIYRGVLFSAARDEGNFYPRWVQPLNSGLGGPLFSFYSPLTYFAMDGLHSLGISHPVAWRILVALALLAASTGVFALVLRLSGDGLAALAASAVYVYAFPLLREFFERGSPEGIAYALYPWVLYGLVLFVQRPSGLHLGLAAGAVAALVLTHNLSAALALLLVGLVTLLMVYRVGWRALGAAAFVLAAGLLLAGFFVIPIVAEQGFVRISNAIQVDYARIAQNPTSVRELLALPQPYDLGLGNNLIGDHLGPLLSLLLVVGLCAAPLLWIRQRRWQALVMALCGLCGVLVIWLVTASSNPLWSALPLLGYVQARTRLMGVCILSITIIAGFLVAVLPGRLRAAVAGALIAASLLLAMPVLYPQLQYRYATFGQEPTAADAQVFMARENPTLTAFGEFLPIWRYAPFSADEAGQVAASPFANLPEGSRILEQQRDMSRVWGRVESPVPFDAAWHVLYFPGWTGEVDGERRSLKPIEGSGYLLLENVPAGDHLLALRYSGTALQRAGVVTSAAAALALLLTAILWRDRAGPSVSATYPASSGWLVAAFVLLLGFKAGYVDRHTELLRRSSSCSAVQGADLSTNVRFGKDLRLCAVVLPRRALEAGEALRIELYWQADRPVPEPAETFVHLLGTRFNPATGNPLWGQQDKQQPGYHPVTRWRPGQIYRDSYEFVVAANAPAGEYQLEIGWVQPASGQRLKPELAGPTEGLAVSSLDSLLISGFTVR
jgi:hypothetical protein